MNACLTSRLARASFMHYDDQGHNALKDHAALRDKFCCTFYGRPLTKGTWRYEGYGGGRAAGVCGV